MIIVVAMALGMPLPILAVQVLWINLINDSLPNVALALDPEETGITNEKPRDPKTPILNTEMKTLIILITVVTGIANFIRFYFFSVRQTRGKAGHCRLVPRGKPKLF